MDIPGADVGSIKAKSGFTLIELLVAIVILMGLMFTANYSYSLYSKYWSGRLGNFDRTVFYAQGMWQLKDTLDATIPYIVTDQQQEYTFYFLGRADGFTAVTAAPIFASSPHHAAVIRVFVESVEQDLGDGNEAAHAVLALWRLIQSLVSGEGLLRVHGNRADRYTGRRQLQLCIPRLHHCHPWIRPVASALSKTCSYPLSLT